MRSLDDPGHIDYLVFSAHKMYAPYGTGVLVGKKGIFLQGAPDLVGGGTVDVVTPDRVDWAGLPDKEEAGSPNVIGAVALAKTILCLQEIGMDALVAHECRLTGYLLQRLAALPAVKVYGISDPERAAEKTGVIPFAVAGLSHMLVAAILSAESGIGVRNGSFCAQPYIRHLLQIDPNQTEIHCDDTSQIRSQMPGLVRVSFGCYNTEAEIDYLIEALERIAKRRYQGKYRFDSATGSFAPREFAPPVSAYFSLH
jgi:selenocysteine lyase/cysteine desulfurase